MNVAVERLGWLRAYLATIDPHTFDMHSFKTTAECGTHMCVGGHMAEIPQFQALGYSLKPSDVYEGHPLVPSMNGFGGALGAWDSLQAALGISYNDVGALCYDYQDSHGEASIPSSRNTARSRHEQRTLE